MGGNTYSRCYDEHHKYTLAKGDISMPVKKVETDPKHDSKFKDKDEPDSTHTKNNDCRDKIAEVSSKESDNKNDDKDSDKKKLKDVEKADKEKPERDKVAKESDKEQRLKGEKEKKSDREKVFEKDKTSKSDSEKMMDKDKTSKDKVEREKLPKEKVSKDKSENKRSHHDKAETDRSSKERLAQEKSEKEKAKSRKSKDSFQSDKSKVDETKTRSSKQSTSSDHSKSSHHSSESSGSHHSHHKVPSKKSTITNDRRDDIFARIAAGEKATPATVANPPPDATIAAANNMSHGHHIKVGHYRYSPAFELIRSQQQQIVKKVSEMSHNSHNHHHHTQTKPKDKDSSDTTSSGKTKSSIRLSTGTKDDNRKQVINSSTQRKGGMQSLTTTIVPKRTNVRSTMDSGKMPNSNKSASSTNPGEKSNKLQSAIHLIGGVRSMQQSSRCNNVNKGDQQQQQNTRQTLATRSTIINNKMQGKTSNQQGRNVSDNSNNDGNNNSNHLPKNSSK